MQKLWLGRSVALAGLALFLPIGAFAQPATQAPVSTVPVPSELEMAKLVWSTMAAVDHANQAGNYSVLRDLSAPGFQAANDSARLTAIFANLRAQNLDLSNTLLLAPTYAGPPRFVQPGIIQMRGFFGLRPTAISFELYYQWINGKWKLFGVSIAPAQIATQQPGGPAPAQPQKGQPKRN